MEQSHFSLQECLWKLLSKENLSLRLTDSCLNGSISRMDCGGYEVKMGWDEELAGWSVWEWGCQGAM